MSKSAVFSTVIAVVLFVLAWTLNPPAQKHRDAIRDLTSERSPLAAALGVGALAAFASSYHSLGVASYTTVGDKTVSWGLFGMVFVSQP